MLRQVELSVGRPPDPTWKRPPGRPRAKWTDQLHRDNNNVPTATLWRQAIGRGGHSRATLRSEPTTRQRRRRLRRRKSENLPTQKSYSVYTLKMLYWILLNLLNFKNILKFINFTEF